MKTNVFISFLFIFLSNSIGWANDNLSGVFIFTSAEFNQSSEEFSKILESNGMDSLAIRMYVENDVFGFNEFKNEVIKHSADLKSVMILFSFHGADAGRHFECANMSTCLQGNLCAIGEQFISAENIVDNFLTPLEGKEIALFFKSCFSGHFAYKVKALASSKFGSTPTPIALIATDNNTETSTMCFPTPDYSFQHTKFYHWQDSAAAMKYEQMQNFFDYVEFVNTYGPKFNFTFFAINGGKNIEIVKFGFKDTIIKPYEESQKKNKIYNQISEKLSGLNLSNLTVLFVESERNYKNLAHGDMWLKAFIQNGALKENIHWIKPAKIGADVNNSQVHSIFETFDFIPEHHKVLLFIRGDDAITQDSLFNRESLQEWALLYSEDKILTAERISELFLSKLQKTSRLLVLICSPHGDYGFKQLVSLLDAEKSKNIGVVAFYSPEREFNNSKFAGWPMGFMAPLYGQQFLFKTGGIFKAIYPKDLHWQKQAIANLELFVKMNSFEDYLKFLQSSEIFYVPKQITVNVHNIEQNDLSDFAFIPSELPKSWYEW